MSPTTKNDSHGQDPELIENNDTGNSIKYELKNVAEDQGVGTIEDDVGTSAFVPERPPLDRYNIVYIILLIHGIGTLMPWNMFINADSYFREYKLSPGPDKDTDELKKIRENFVFYLGLSSQLPNVLFNGLNLIFNVGSGNLNLRVNVTLAIELLVFGLTLALVMIDTTTWSVVFFYITIGSVIILNMCSGIYQNCVFGTGASFPGRYTNAILIGSNFSGTFTSIVRLVSSAMMPDSKSSATFYFSTASFVIVSCLITYNYLPSNQFYSHYRKTTRNTQPNVEEAKSEDVLIVTPTKLSVLSKCWPQCLNIFITFYVTLTLFPNVLSNINLKPATNKLGLSDDNLIPVGCFFVFNFTALLGNILASYTNWPGKERTWILVFARFIFIPIFLSFDFLHDARSLPVLFNNYILYVFINAIFGLTSGYFSSICMIFVSQGLKKSEAPVAGMLASFFLVLGIFVGINMWTILKWIVLYCYTV